MSGIPLVFVGFEVPTNIKTWPVLYTTYELNAIKKVSGLDVCVVDPIAADMGALKMSIVAKANEKSAKILHISAHCANGKIICGFATGTATAAGGAVGELFLDHNDLLEILQATPNVKLVVLNACRSVVIYNALLPWLRGKDLVFVYGVTKVGTAGQQANRDFFEQFYTAVVDSKCLDFTSSFFVAEIKRYTDQCLENLKQKNKQQGSINIYEKFDVGAGLVDDLKRVGRHIVETHQTAVMLVVSQRSFDEQRAEIEWTLKLSFDPHGGATADRRFVTIALENDVKLPGFMIDFVSEDRKSRAYHVLVVVAQSISRHLFVKMKRFAGECGASFSFINRIISNNNQHSSSSSTINITPVQLRTASNTLRSLELSFPVDADIKISDICSTINNTIIVQQQPTIEDENNPLISFFNETTAWKRLLTDINIPSTIINESLYVSIGVNVVAMLNSPTPSPNATLEFVEFEIGDNCGALVASKLIDSVRGDGALLEVRDRRLIVLGAKMSAAHLIAFDQMIARIEGVTVSSSSTPIKLPPQDNATVPDGNRSEVVAALIESRSISSISTSTATNSQQQINNNIVVVVNQQELQQYLLKWQRLIDDEYLVRATTFGLSTPLNGDNYLLLKLKLNNNQIVDNPMEIKDALRDVSIALIEGEAGSGKSTILRKLMSTSENSSSSSTNDEEARLMIRTDILWRHRQRLMNDNNVDEQAVAVVKSHIETLKLASLSKPLSSDIVDDVKLESSLITLLKAGRCSLMLDAIDEVQPHERSTVEFRQFVQLICNSIRNNNNNNNNNVADGLFRRVIMTSRPSIVDDVMNLQRVKRFTIASLDEPQGPQYIQQLLTNWNRLNDFGHSIDVAQLKKTVWNSCEHVGPNVTPLMLLMLTRLCCRKQFNNNSNNVELTNRFMIYESFTDMLLERSADKFSKEKVDVLPKWSINDDKTIRNDFKQWLIDMLSLIGAVMHMIGDDVESGGASIRKYDVALTLEMTFADAIGRRVNIRPPGCPSDVDWIDELDRIYQQQQQQSSSSSSTSSTTTNRKTAAKYEGFMMWILVTVFGLVSIQPHGEGQGSLDDRIMFGHRSFQEFLTTRALLLEGRNRTDFAVLREFKWHEARIVANQWWDNVWLFVAALQGLDKTFELLTGPNVERFDDWRDRLTKANGIDVNDLGHTRLVTLLRCLAAASNQPISMDSLFFLLLSIIHTDREAFYSLMTLVGIDRLKSIWNRPTFFYNRNDLIQRYNIEPRYVGLDDDSMQAISSTVRAGATNKRVERQPSTITQPLTSLSSSPTSISSSLLSSFAPSTLPASLLPSKQPVSTLSSSSSFQSPSQSSLIATNAARLQQHFSSSTADHLMQLFDDEYVFDLMMNRIRLSSSDDDANELWTAFSIGLIRSAQSSSIDRSYVDLVNSVLQRSQDLLRRLSTTDSVMKVVESTKLIGIDANDLVLVVVSAATMSDRAWRWMVSSSASWFNATSIPKLLLRQIDSNITPLVTAYLTLDESMQLLSIAPFWMLSRRRCGFITTLGVSWHVNVARDVDAHESHNFKSLPTAHLILRFEDGTSEDHFRPVDALKLNLASRKLTSIENIESLKSLRELTLTSNSLTDLDCSLLPADLIELSCGENRLTAVASLSRLQKLNNLFLSNNQLKMLPGLEFLTNLTIFNLSENQLTATPGVEFLTNLTNLILSGSNLTSLPDLSRLVNLQYLTVSKNKLKQLPRLGNLTKLVQFLADHNELESIDVSGLTSLCLLYLDHNKLTTIVGLASLRTLRDLLLNNNLLEEINGIEHLGGSLIYVTVDEYLLSQELAEADRALRRAEADAALRHAAKGMVQIYDQQHVQAIVAFARANNGLRRLRPN